MRAQHHSRSARDIRSNYLEVERRDSIPTDGIGPGNHPSGRMKRNPYFAKTCVHTLSPQKISELQSLLRSTEAKLSVGKKNVLQGLLITVNNLVLPPLCIRNPIMAMGHSISERAFSYRRSWAVVL